MSIVSENDPKSTGDAYTPGKVRVLDPADPVAIELARLYDVLRAANVVDIDHQRRLKPIEDRIIRHRGPAPEGDELKWYRDQHDILWSGFGTVLANRDAYYDLLHAVVAAHGGGNATLEEWYSFGTAHRVVMVGNRVYSASSEPETDFEEETVNDLGDGACVVLNVFDIP